MQDCQSCDGSSILPGAAIINYNIKECIMAKLHQLLAVESSLDGNYPRLCAETKNVVSKQNLFTGSHRKLNSWEDDGIDYPEEHQNMTTTVRERLNYTGEAIESYLNALQQKEATNQTAVADLIVDGRELIHQAPATYLLGLEARLKFIRSIYDQIPTLQSGIEWKKSIDMDDTWEMAHPEEKIKTKLTFKSQVLVEPTEFQPAQIEKWEEQIPVGKFVRLVWCSMFTSAEKSQVLGRIDRLIIAVKQARQKANNAEVVAGKAGTAIVDFINTG